MDTESTRLVEQLFDAAADLPPEQRPHYLRQQCSDGAVIARVERLLRHDELAGERFLRGEQYEVIGASAGEALPLQPIGPYTLLRVLGEGGMGTVYEAQQDHPRRRVALKLIRPGYMTASMRRRFEYEADMLGRLDHPGIARIYDAGIAQTSLGRQPFFAMELVQGVSLDQWIKQNSFPLKQRLELWIDICNAVHHAHTKGVIHRDLKPSNILVNEGEPKILDFGVARAIDSDVGAATMHTESGQLVGTLPYMAPEQAAGKVRELDTSSDVYALGVIAYELLSGRMPYAIAGLPVHDAVRIICEQEPSRLSSIDRSLRGDVETIVCKALEKDKTRRYQTAGELAEDVQRHLDYEPIAARPPSTWYQLSRFARRNKLLVGGVGILIIILGAGIVGTSIGLLGQTRHRNVAERQTALAQQSTEEANKQRAFAEVETLRAKQETERASEQASLARRRLYAAQMNLAQQAWVGGDGARTLELLEGQRPKFDQEDLRAFEWYYLWRLCQADLRFTLRNPLIGHQIAFSPDGKTLASTCADTSVKLWDITTGRARTTLWGRHGTRGGAAFSPNGKLLVTSGFRGQATVWDLTSGLALPANFPEHSMERSLAFSPDGETLVGGNFFGTIRVWDVATWREKHSIAAHSAPVNSLGFSADGTAMVSVSEFGDARTKVWDMTVAPPRAVRDFEGQLSAVLSLDGKSLAIGQFNGRVKRYDVATGAEKTGYSSSGGAVYSVAFSPDAMRVGLGTHNRSARIWDPATGTEQAYAHLGPVKCVAFSPDGQTFASASEDGTIKLWDVATPPGATNFQLPKGSRSPVFSPDGTTLAFIGAGASIELLDSTMRKSRTLAAAAYKTGHLTFSADGKMLALSSSSRAAVSDIDEVRLYDVSSGDEVARLKARTFAFSPDGKTFATASSGKPSVTQVWDSDTKRIRVRLKGVPQGTVCALAFSPEGKTLAVGGQFGWVKLWDPVTGVEKSSVQSEVGAYHWIGSLAFSLDGVLLAIGNWDGTVKLWDVNARQPRASLKGHTAPVNTVAFLPRDGRTLLTASADRTLKFWDIATKQERFALNGHSPERHSLAVHPNGTMLADVSEDGVINLRCTATGSDASAYQTEVNPDDPEGAIARNKAADAHWAAGRRDEARKVYQQIATRLESATGTQPQPAECLQELIHAHFALSVLLRDAGERAPLDASHRVIELSTELLRDYLDPVGHSIALAERCATLGRALSANRFSDEAESVFREGLALERKLGGQGIAAAVAMTELASFFQSQGKLPDAEALYRQTLEMPRAMLGPDRTTATLIQLAGLLGGQKRDSEAEALLRECLTIRLESYATGDWRIASVKSLLGASLAAQGKNPEAEKLLLAAHGEMARSAALQGGGQHFTGETRSRIIQFYRAWKKPEQVLKWTTSSNLP